MATGEGSISRSIVLLAASPMGDGDVKLIEISASGPRESDELMLSQTRSIDK